MEYAKLNVLLGKMVEYQDRKSEVPFEHVRPLLLILGA